MRESFKFTVCMSLNGKITSDIVSEELIGETIIQLLS